MSLVSQAKLANRGAVAGPRSAGPPCKGSGGAPDLLPRTLPSSCAFLGGRPGLRRPQPRSLRVPSGEAALVRAEAGKTRGCYLTKQNFRERRRACEMQGSLQETSILHTGSPPPRVCVAWEGPPGAPGRWSLCRPPRNAGLPSRIQTPPSPPSFPEVSRMPAPRLTLARAPCCWSRREGEGGGLRPGSARVS